MVDISNKKTKNDNFSLFSVLYVAEIRRMTKENYDGSAWRSHVSLVSKDKRSDVMSQIVESLIYTLDVFWDIFRSKINGRFNLQTIEYLILVLMQLISFNELTIIHSNIEIFAEICCLVKWYQNKSEATNEDEILYLISREIIFSKKVNQHITWNDIYLHIMKRDRYLDKTFFSLGHSKSYSLLSYFIL